MQIATIYIHDVTVDGFPPKGDFAFIHDGDIYSGWPLIDRDNSHRGNGRFKTPEQAAAAPLDVYWEASEDCVHGTFSDVRYWFPIPDLNSPETNPFHRPSAPAASSDAAPPG